MLVSYAETIQYICCEYNCWCTSYEAYMQPKKSLAFLAACSMFRGSMLYAQYFVFYVVHGIIFTWIQD